MPATSPEIGLLTTHEQIARAFFIILKNELGPDKIEQIRNRNATDKYQSDICASHDFCDANVTLAVAFEIITNNEIDIQNDQHVETWNAAWKIAKAQHLTA